MLRVTLASLRRRAGRALALLLGVLVATTGFTVLTGSTETARLQVTGTVGEHYRGAYDILVRPTGACTELEEIRLRDGRLVEDVDLTKGEPPETTLLRATGLRP